jgi:hypothetical protein
MQKESHMKKMELLCVGTILLSPLQSFAAMDLETLFRMPTFKLGIASGAGSVEVSDGNTLHDVKFKSTSSISPLITLIQSPYYFNDETRWGYHTEINARYFKLDYDDKSSDFVDGELEGYSASLTPVLFYQWGHKKLCESCRSWRVEVGAGVNYLYSDGDVKSINGDKTDFSSSGFGFNSHVGTVVNYHQWELGLRLVVPTRIDDEVKARHALSNVNIAYRF